MAGNIKGHPAILSLFASRLPGLQKRDGSYWAKCIFHPDNNPSLNVGLDEAGEYVFHCFGCGEGGDVIKFLQKTDSLTFKKAKELVEKTTGGDWEETKKLAEATFQKLEVEKVPLTRYKLDQYAKFEVALYESSEAKEWLFSKRGITYDTARKLHFGYCPDLAQLNGPHYNESFKPIAQKGWIVTPSIEKDEVVCIEARSLVEKKFVRKTGMNNKVLFGTEFLTWDEPIFVVEGHFDQAIMIQAGYRCVSLPNASANISPDQRDLLMSASVVILAGDNDGGSGTDKMIKLWNEFQERTYRLVWPKGMKDANQTFLEYCERDIEKFKSLVDDLMLQAYSNPIPGVKSIQDILTHDESDGAEDHPDRFRFGITAVDKMANIFPGSVVYVSATQTSTGKTQFCLQETLNAARKRDEVVLNYQTEMQDNEIGEIVTANLLAKDRNSIRKEDRMEAAKKLKGVSYYIGNNPNLNRASEVLDLIEAGIRRVGASVVVLDHIHFICRNEKDEIKSQSQAMQRIKRMSQKYLVKFFVVGQPRKPSEKVQGKPIGIYDAKGSEAIVSDSDVVLFLHREVIKNVTEETADNLSPEVQVRCMKGRRRGKGGAFCKLFFLGNIATFREVVKVEEPVVNQTFDF